ncbi:MAG: type II toxin-antitoxin system RelE/ParE family toxin [Chthoniobacterales bacterium]|nr:type II toxin-antitoxin system RelE/ParE family toxin [Chthoniobacterales bacterium]
MDFKVLVTDNAIADLKDIVEFVAQHDPTAAQRLAEKLLSRALSLAQMPERFPLHDSSRGIRKMPSSPFLIFYTANTASRDVNILHFWHGARQTPQFSA